MENFVWKDVMNGFDNLLKDIESLIIGSLCITKWDDETRKSFGLPPAFRITKIGDTRRGIHGVGVITLIEHMYIPSECILIRNFMDFTRSDGYRFAIDAPVDSGNKEIDDYLYSLDPEFKSLLLEIAKRAMVS